MPSLVADTHLFGSRHGYECLAKSPGVTSAEDRTLSEFGFGQSSDDRFLKGLPGSPTAFARQLPGGRVGVTRVLAGPLDDSGRPTLERRTLILSLADYLAVRRGMHSLLADVRTWSAGEFASGARMRFSVAAGGRAVPSDAAWRVFDAWFSALERPPHGVVVGSDDAAAEQVLETLACVADQDAASFSWGIRLLSPIAWVDVISLSPYGTMDHRRPVHGVSPSGCVNPAIRAARQSQPLALPACADLRNIDLAPPSGARGGKTGGLPKPPVGGGSSGKVAGPVPARLVAWAGAIAACLIGVAGIFWWSFPRSSGGRDPWVAGDPPLTSTADLSAKGGNGAEPPVKAPAGPSPKSESASPPAANSSNAPNGVNGDLQGGTGPSTQGGVAASGNGVDEVHKAEDSVAAAEAVNKAQQAWSSAKKSLTEAEKSLSAAENSLAEAEKREGDSQMSPEDKVGSPLLEASQEIVHAKGNLKKAHEALDKGEKQLEAAKKSAAEGKFTEASTYAGTVSTDTVGNLLAIVIKSCSVVDAKIREAKERIESVPAPGKPSSPPIDVIPEVVFADEQLSRIETLCELRRRTLKLWSVMAEIENIWVGPVKPELSQQAVASERVLALIKLSKVKKVEGEAKAVQDKWQELLSSKRFKETRESGLFAMLAARYRLDWKQQKMSESLESVVELALVLDMARPMAIQVQGNGALQVIGTSKACKDRLDKAKEFVTKNAKEAEKPLAPWFGLFDYLFSRSCSRDAADAFVRKAATDPSLLPGLLENGGRDGGLPNPIDLVKRLGQLINAKTGRPLSENVQRYMDESKLFPPTTP